jgi:hypothetical protein
MSYCCYNNQKQLGLDRVQGVIVLTINVKARPETVIIDANNTHVVITYDTIYDALLGHTYWCSEVADALKNNNIISNARCECVMLKPRDDNDPNYLASSEISADCFNY